MTEEDRKDLAGFYNDAAYEHAKLADLSYVLTNDEWDEFAKAAGEKAMELVDRLIDERFTEIQAKADAEEAEARAA